MKLENKSALITGIGGFIGSHLAERARDAGMKVYGIELNPELARQEARKGAEVLAGDMTSESALLQIFQNPIDLVFHTAAVVEEGGSMEFFRKINVEGTSRIIQNAEAAGVGAFVQFSSVMVYGFRYPDMADENAPLRGENNPYCQTKIESENIVRQYFDSSMKTLIIRPGDVYGPGSQPWVVRPLRLMKDKLFFLPDGGRGIMNHVYISNLLDAIFLALEKDAWNTVFNVTDCQATTFKEYFSWLAHVADLPLPASLPAPIMQAIGFTLEHGSKLFGRKPPITADAIKFLERKYPYSSQKAVRELGYSPKINLETGMGRIREWLKTNPIF